MNVELPDGTVIEDIPDGTTKAQLVEKLKANGMNVPQEWLGDQPRQSPRQRLLDSLPNPLTTLSSVPASALNAAKGVGNIVAHPVDTASTLIDAAAGGLQKGVLGMLPQSMQPDKTKESFLYSPRADQTANAVASIYKNRYGSPEAIKNTIETDPVGFALDVSSLAGLGKSALNAAGRASLKLAEKSTPAVSNALSKVGAATSNASKTAGAVSTATDPFLGAGKVYTHLVKPAYSYLVGQVTGSGMRAVGDSLRDSPAFKNSFLGKTQESDVLDMARQALQKVKDKRGEEYRNRLEKIKASNQQLDITDIKNRAAGWLKNYNVKNTPDGELDFSRSDLANNKPAQAEVKQVYDTIASWGSRPGDNTPKMLDTLKRVIGNSYTESSQARSMVTDLESMVREKISKAIPEYKTMTEGYKKASDKIRDFEKALVGKQGSSSETALRKLLTAVREEKTFRKDLIESLGKEGSVDLMGAISGLVMKPWWSNRLGPMAATAEATYAALTHNPSALFALPLASPRAMGYLGMGLGKSEKYAPKVPRKTLTQAGRMGDTETNQ